MIIKKIRQTVEDAWNDAKAEWKDDLSVKYHKTVIMTLSTLSDDMKKNSINLHNILEDTHNAINQYKQ